MEPLGHILNEMFPQGVTPEALDLIAGRTAVPTGFIDLDRLLQGGLHRSDLVTVAARPSMGKTALGLSIACNAVRLNYTVAIFSLEMSRLKVVERLLSIESEVDSVHLREGRLSPGDIRRLGEATNLLSRAPVYIDDTVSMDASELCARARELHLDHPLDLIIVDCLQLAGPSRGEGEYEQTSATVRTLKALARELNTPVLAFPQLSRATDARWPHIPILSDLRESGSIEEDSDLVMFIYREDVYHPDSDKKGIAEIHVAKHRNGPAGAVSLLFLERTTRFVDLADAGS